MSGKPASRIGDGVSHGVIVGGSGTVLIGSVGGVACSVCPGGMAVGSPVNPALGAKVLAGETDFLLPAAAMPFALSRTYSSYVNAEHGGRCGILGYGWGIDAFGYRAVLEEGRTLLFDPGGRTITFPEALPPGADIHSRPESLWLLRGGPSCAWRALPRWEHVPPEWADDPGCVIAASGTDT
ncbi:MAG: DUF6531 domain-containing protein, partial [Azoarcus sp.]|nr:DUF6531 domain-containing protein [Azoarcus sp.]